MKLHPRYFTVENAEIELTKAFLEIAQREQLTEGETLRVVNSFATKMIAGTAKFIIRRERHGDEDKEGDSE